LDINNANNKFKMLYELNAEFEDEFQTIQPAKESQGLSEEYEENSLEEAKEGDPEFENLL